MAEMNFPSLMILKLRSDSSQKETRKEKKTFVGTNVKETNVEGSDTLMWITRDATGPAADE